MGFVSNGSLSQTVCYKVGSVKQTKPAQAEEANNV